jgi:hypothetical protein
MPDSYESLQENLKLMNISSKAKNKLMTLYRGNYGYFESEWLGILLD